MSNILTHGQVKKILLMKEIPVRSVNTSFGNIIDKIIQYIKRLRLSKIEHDLLLPKYFYHAPMDYNIESYPPTYGQSIIVEGESLPVPPPECRPGYSPDNDQHYLNWGRYDHDLIIDMIKKHYGFKDNIAILDWGCSSGRVLRHFYSEMKEHSWKLHGTDIQAFLVEWMRQNFPPEIDIMCGTTYPHLPFKDSSLDVMYGISVFTHTKYLWDIWLAEFRRVLKRGGLCIQTVQCEAAWKFYHENRTLDWVRNGHPSGMLNKQEIDSDFFFYGDGFISQTFYREKAVKKLWGRYMKVVEFISPPPNSYQNWIVLKNDY